jgi:hypothetical protein
MASIWSKELHSPDFRQGDRVEWNKAWEWVLSHSDPSAPIKYLEVCIEMHKTTFTQQQIDMLIGGTISRSKNFAPSSGVSLSL